MNSFKLLSIFLLGLAGIQFASAQDSAITVKGNVIQNPPIGFGDLLVVNTTTGRGVFGNIDGSFEIAIHKNDTIKVSCRGFKTVEINFRDSIYKPVYHITVYLGELEIVLDRPIVIRPLPGLDEIEEARSKIGSFKYEPLVAPGIAGILSPITLLYQLFSKKEAEKRKYAELVNQKEMEDALKDLTRYMIYFNVIDLSEDEIDLFLTTCPLDQEFVQKESLYNVSLALKNCYEIYRNKRRY